MDVYVHNNRETLREAAYPRGCHDRIEPMSPINRYIADGLGLPPKRVTWFLVTLAAAILSGSIWLYQDKAYPHGPRVFTGDYEVVCKNDGRTCREVPVYKKEDTSRLNNPAWVRFIRNIGILFPIGFGIAALFHGNKLVGHRRVSHYDLPSPYDSTIRRAGLQPLEGSAGPGG